MKGIGKRLICMAVLLAAALLCGMLLPREKSRSAAAEGTLQPAELPVMYMEWNGTRLGPVFGYTREMDDGVGSEHLLPFSEELTLPFFLTGVSQRPDSIGYEVRGLEDGRLLERGTADDAEGGRGSLSFTLNLKDLWEAGTVYRLCFTLRWGEKEAYYYMQIFQPVDTPLERLLDYAITMHEALFDPERALPYAAKLEVSDLTDKNTLAYVNIGSSFSQVSWGNSGAVQISDTWVRLLSVEGIYGQFLLTYLVEAPTGEDTKATFRVEEYISLQMYTDVTYLLGYERHMEELWRASADNLFGRGIMLGVQEEDRIAALSNEKVSAFTVGGELYLYENEPQRLTRVFSFRTDGEEDVRSLCSHYGIKLLNLDEEGNVSFLLYGYMNGGGDREGSSGISYFQYSPAANLLTERLFLSSGQPFDLLKEDVDTLLYENQDGFLYFCFENKVYVYDRGSGEATVLVTEDEMKTLCVSQSGTRLAWKTADGAIRLMDLEEHSDERIRPAADDFADVLCFIREDILLGYGHSYQPSVSVGEDESVTPYYRLEILAEDGACLLYYAYDDICVTGVEADSEKVTVHRCTQEGSVYRNLNDDVLLHKKQTDVSADIFTSYQSETLLRETVLPVGKLPSFLRLDTGAKPDVLLNTAFELPIYGTSGKETVRFLAYGRGRMQGIYPTLGAAVRAAEGDYGYVTDQSGVREWSWRTKQPTLQLSLEGVDRKNEDGQLRNVTGMSFRALTYFLNEGTPVKWVSQNGSVRWIIGYDRENAMIYSSADGKTSKVPLEELEKELRETYEFLWVNRK